MTLSPIPSPAAETWWRSPRAQLRGATAGVSGVNPAVAPPPQGYGSWTPSRAVVAVLAHDALARPELLRAEAEALAFRSDGEIVVDAPGRVAQGDRLDFVGRYIERVRAAL
jgi:hypothetical protein